MGAGESRNRASFISARSGIWRGGAIPPSIPSAHYRLFRYGKITVKGLGCGAFARGLGGVSSFPFLPDPARAMDQAQFRDTRTVLILKADKLYAESLRSEVYEVLQRPSIRLATSVADAARMLGDHRADLLLTGGAGSIQGNVLDFLATCTTKPILARRVFVLTTHGEFRLLSALRSLPIQGLFDSAHDEPKNFIPALRTVAAGGRYWSPSAMQRISHPASKSDSLLRILTLFEQVVLSVVGDGSDDITAARELGLSPATISTVRRHLHRKLGVQHRGELVRIAAQNGFVRFTPAGVVRPGFATLTAVYRARRRKPATLVLDESCPARRT